MIHTIFQLNDSYHISHLKNANNSPNCYDELFFRSITAYGSHYGSPELGQGGVWQDFKVVSIIHDKIKSILLGLILRYTLIAAAKLSSYILFAPFITMMRRG